MAAPEKPAPSSPSILMYSHDGFGLGHIRRNLNIASRAVNTLPGCKALLLMSHTSVPFLPQIEGIDFIKLPSIIKVESEKWEPRTLPMAPEAFKEFRSSLILNVAEHFNPALFLVDYMPSGVWGELLPTLELLKKRNTRIILGLRDILDDPQKTCDQWTREGSYEIIKSYYDQVFIYGSPDIYDTASQYGLSRTLGNKVEYLGYLSSDEKYRPKESVRQELNIQASRLIVVTGGGGSDAYPMMKKALEGLKKLSPSRSCEALFITGPLMGEEQRSLLKEQAEGFPVKILNSSEGILNYLNCADLLITMGSYNTLMEAIRLKKPTLVIPREGPSAEQQIRTAVFSQRGFVHALSPPSELNPASLAATIEQFLSGEKTINPPSLPFEGDKIAVEKIRQLLDTQTSEAGIEASL